MKYFSEVTKKIYDSVNELKEAETAVSDKAAARKKDAEVVETSYQEYITARRKYEKALTDFCNKHGAYHHTIKYNSNNEENTTKDFTRLSDLIDLLF